MKSRQGKFSTVVHARKKPFATGKAVFGERQRLQQSGLSWKRCRHPLSLLPSRTHSPDAVQLPRAGEPLRLALRLPPGATAPAASGGGAQAAQQQPGPRERPPAPPRHHARSHTLMGKVENEPRGCSLLPPRGWQSPLAAATKSTESGSEIINRVNQEVSLPITEP